MWSRDVTFDERSLEGQRDTSLESDQDFAKLPYEVWNRPLTFKGPDVMQYNAESDGVRQ